MCSDDADNVAIRPARICRSATSTASFKHILDIARYNMLVITNIIVQKLLMKQHGLYFALKLCIT